MASNPDSEETLRVLQLEITGAHLGVRKGASSDSMEDRRQVE
jgi:hypothetical protein